MTILQKNTLNQSLEKHTAGQPPGQSFGKRCSFLMLSVSMAGMLSFVAQKAQAADVQNLRPVTPWSVSKLETSKTSLDTYCALSRRYDGDVILTFAENGTGKSSLAVDFQKPVFPKRQNYNISIQPERGTQKSQSVKPVSEKAFVLKLGDDGTFLESLSNSRVMTVALTDKEIDKNYGFDIADYKNGRMQLTACIESLSPITMAAVNKDQASGAPARYIQTSPPTNFAEVKASSLKNIEQENKALKQKLEHTQALYESSREPDISPNRLAELNEKLELLQRENSNLVSRLRQTATSSDTASSQISQSYDKQVEALQEQMQDLKTQYDSQTARVKELELSLQQKNKSLGVVENELEQNRQKLKISGDGALSTDDALVNELARAQAALKNQRNQHEAELSAIEEIMSGNEQAVSMLEKQFQTKILSLESEKERESTKANQLAGQVDALQQSLSALKEQDMSMSGTLRGEVDALQAAIKRKDAAIASLEKTLETYEANATATAASSQQIAQIVAEMDTQKQSYQSTIANLESTLKSKDAIIQEQQQKISSFLSEQAKGDTSDLNKKYLSAQQELDSARGAIQDQAIRFESTVDRLQNDVKAREAEIAKLKLRMASLDNGTDADAVPYVQKDVPETAKPAIDPALLANLKAELQSERSARQGEGEKYTAEIKSLKSEIERLSAAEDTKPAVPVKEPAKDMVSKAQYDDLSAELLRMQEIATAQASQYENRISSLEEMINEQQLMIADAKNAQKLASEKSETKDVSPKIKTLEENLANLQSENRQLKMTLEDQSGKQELVDAYDSLAQFSRLEAEIASVRRERDHLALELDKMQNVKDDKLLSISSDNWDLEKATSRYNEAERQIRRMGKQLEVSRAKCERDLKDLELKLFDPKLASTEQLSRLVTLEQKLVQAEEKLSASNAQQANAQPSRRADIDVAVLAPPSGYASRAVVDNRASVKATAPEVIKTSYSAQPEASAPSSGIAPVKGLLSSDGMRALLMQNNVPIKGAVAPVKGSARRDFVSYQWETDTLYGSAEQRVMSGSNASFDDLTTAYIDQIRNRCGGDFAAVPVSKKSGNGIVVKSYDIACVSQGVNASASVVFYSQDGVFTTIAHESDVNSMEMAMDIRDRFVSRLTN